MTFDVQWTGDDARGWTARRGEYQLGVYPAPNGWEFNVAHEPPPTRGLIQVDFGAGLASADAAKADAVEAARAHMRRRGVDPDHDPQAALNAARAARAGYMAGWQDGAALRRMARRDADYERGHAAGKAAFLTADAAERARLGLAPRLVFTPAASTTEPTRSGGDGT